MKIFKKIKEIKHKFYLLSFYNNQSITYDRISMNGWVAFFNVLRNIKIECVLKQTKIVEKIVPLVCSFFLDYSSLIFKACALNEW